MLGLSLVVDETHHNAIQQAILIFILILILTRSSSFWIKCFTSLFLSAAVSSAVRTLTALGALDENEELTALVQ